MSLAPSDYVGWTVTVHENDVYCPEGVFFCVGRTGLGSLQLAMHNEARDPNVAEKTGVNWYARPEFVTRLRRGDFAP